MSTLILPIDGTKTPDKYNVNNSEANGIGWNVACSSNQVDQLFFELYSGKEAAGVSAGSYMAQCHH